MLMMPLNLMVIIQKIFIGLRGYQELQKTAKAEAAMTTTMSCERIIQTSSVRWSPYNIDLIA